MRPFHLEAGGAVSVSFSALESELISDLANQVCELLGDGSGLADDRLLASVGIGGSDGLSADPAIARLLPDAYRDDAAASTEFRHLTERSLADRKIANAQRVIASLRDGGALDVDAQQAWLRTLTDIRLVIASRLGIESDEDAGTAESDEELMLLDVYAWLGMVQGTLVEALDG